MNSKIYIGTIEHRRYAPIDHHLSYPIYIYGLDLDDLPQLDLRYPLFGYNRVGVTAIHDKDYLQPGKMPIKQKVNHLLAQHKVDEPVTRIILISSARYFNYVFNPVNFHYCFTADNKLAAVVAEVSNTYGERHPYVLTEKATPLKGWFARYETQKTFHVSPFNTIEGDYHFYFSDPGDQINIRIELIQKNKKIMEANLAGHALAMTSSNHFRMLLKKPFAPHLSIPRIYSHAFKLFFQKKLAFNDKPVPKSPVTLTKQTPNLMENICKRFIISALKKINTGSLLLNFPDQRTIQLGEIKDVPTAEIHIKDFNFFSRIMFNGEIGFGESYMHGEWDSPDPVSVLKLLIENRDQFSDGNMILSVLTRIQEKLAHDKRKNTIENTPQNIADHYDLSNELYALFLDRQMIYSCGIFKDKKDTLEAAQKNKMQRILDQTEVTSNHHLLEIGCGWGGFAVFAVKQTGCRVTGITVSKAQHERACQRVKDEGLEDSITILRQDYRHMTGTYDRIVSIEMIEAVGPQFLGHYFHQCKTLLKPGGTMVFQAITIVDDRYERYCKERDWIQKHIFPGGHLPCLTVLNSTIHAHSDFKVVDVYHMGPHYAATLAHWQSRFVSQKDKIHAMGFGDEFLRKWIYYFSICEAGFDTAGIDDIQVTLRR